MPTDLPGHPFETAVAASMAQIDRPEIVGHESLAILGSDFDRLRHFSNLHLRVDPRAITGR